MNPMMPNVCSCGAWNVGTDHCATCGKDIKTFTFLNNSDTESKLARLIMEELDEGTLETIIEKIVSRKLAEKK